MGPRAVALVVGILLAGGLALGSTPARAVPEDFVEACSNGITVPDPEDNPGLVQDCAILLSARDTLAGDFKLDWSADRPIERWHGVDLGDYPRRVTGLRLPHTRINGVIPAEVGDLPALAVLDFRRTRLTGPIPGALGSQPALQSVLLGGAYNLTGCIPPVLSERDHDVCVAPRGSPRRCLARVFCQEAPTLVQGWKRVERGSYLVLPPGQEPYFMSSIAYNTGVYLREEFGFSPFLSDDPAIVRQHPLWRDPALPSSWRLVSCRAAERIEGEYDGWEASYVSPSGEPAVHIAVHWRVLRPLNVEARDDGTTYELRTLDGASALIERPPVDKDLPTTLRVFEEWTGVEYVVAASDSALAADLDAMIAIARSLFSAPIYSELAMSPAPADTGTGLAPTPHNPPPAAGNVFAVVVTVIALLGIVAGVRTRHRHRP